MNGPDVFHHVLLSLAAVVGVGWLLGRLVRAVGQPAVVGEVAAGLLLGPSVLGAVWPEGMHALVPDAAGDPRRQVSAALGAIAQLGAVLYMFLVGLELDAAALRRQARAAFAIANASIAVPFGLGAALAVLVHDRYAPAGTPLLGFALFLGVAMAITAFPVLARILADRGMSRTPLGVLALGCAAAGDVTAWCLLAVAVGAAQSQPGGATVPILGAVAFVAFTLFIVKPLAARMVKPWDDPAKPLPVGAMAGTMFAVLLAALATDAIGVHAIFGAFLLGLAVPHDSRLARELTAKVATPVTVLLVPAFFAFTGLRTQIGSVSGATDWLWCLAVTLVATLGKFGGTLAAARWVGRPWRESAALGALMNSRGLMELIVLNVGLDLGILSPPLYAMIVLMALATTAMTAPLLSLFHRPDADAAPPQP